MADENTFRFFLIAVSVLQIAMSARYLRAARAGSTIFRHREEGIVLSITIGVFYLAYVASVLIYFINPQWMTWSALELSAGARWCGVVPLLAGAYLMIAGLDHLGTNLTISISTNQQHELITTGPYRWVRHPLYTAGMLQSVGVCMLMANWFAAIAAFLFWTTIVIRTPMEERKLIEQFGDQYQQYAARVGRFVPRP